MEKFIIAAHLRDLESQVSKGDISYSRMVEILNEEALEYAKKYAKIREQETIKKTRAVLESIFSLK